MTDKKVGIVGSGLVGKSWAMIFASVGYQVSIYDVLPSQVEKAIADIASELDKFEKDGVLRGTLTAADQKKNIRGCTDLAECVKDTVYIQECVPESVDLKRKVWTSIDEVVTSDETIFASSTSCIVPSKISETLKHRGQFIVAHPVNPPYHAPMVELVPAPWTTDSIRSRSRAIMQEVGQVPVSLSRELPGFILNRMQYALLNECWRLIADGVVSADDLDVVMRDGLGLRYAFLGPMEVIHLNADGTYNYFERYGKTINDVSKDFGAPPESMRMESADHLEEVKRISAQLEALYPLDKLDERRLRRDKGLAALAKLKRELAKEEEK